MGERGGDPRGQGVEGAAQLQEPVLGGGVGGGGANPKVEPE